MEPVESAAALAEILARPLPVAVVEGVFGRAPAARCYLAGCRLGQVCRWALGPAAVRWEADGVRWDSQAATLARLRAVLLRDPDGTPLSTGHGDDLLTTLPAGLIDRLAYASDRAGGYQPPQPLETVEDDWPAAYASTRPRLVAGLLPMAPGAALCIHPYDFAALAAAEDAATVRLGAGELRVEVLAFPTLVAASLRAGPDPDAPPLCDATTARDLPYGAARTIVETADILSEIGGPDPALRFLEPARRDVDGPGPVDLAPDGPFPERAPRRAGR